jgi:hypothetical protein
MDGFKLESLNDSLVVNWEMCAATIRYIRAQYLKYSGFISREAGFPLANFFPRSEFFICIWSLNWN